MTDLFNRMMESVEYKRVLFFWLTHLHSSCHAKCIGLRYTEADLNKGESVCVDRCVAKFAEVQKKVEERLRAASGGSGVTEGFGSL